MSRTFPKFEKVIVTKDTEIPALIPKDQRKKNPDQKEYEKVVNELDSTINNLKEKIVSIKTL